MRKSLPLIVGVAATGVFLGALYLYLWGDVTVGAFLGATLFAGLAFAAAATLGLLGAKENAPPGEGGASSSS